MNELNRIYKECLKAWGVDIKPDFRLMFTLDGNEYPIQLDEKPVYLPTDDALASDTDKKAFFHPGCESIISRETDIFKIIRNVTGLHLLSKFKRYPLVLFDLAEKKQSKNLNNERNEILSPLRKNTKKCHDIERLFNLMEVEYHSGDNVDKRFIYFEINKGGKSRLTNKKIYYSAKPIFPFYNEICRKLARNDNVSGVTKVDLFGEKFSIDTLKLAEHIFKSIIPRIDDVEAYESEQELAECARFLVYCNSYILVADSINRIQSLFRSDFDKVGVFNLDLSFKESLESLPEYYNLVPPLEYNNLATSIESNAVTSSVVNNSLANSLIGTSNLGNNLPANSNVNVATVVDTSTLGNIMDGYKDKVIAELKPGETWIGVTVDPMTKQFLHQVNGPMGQMVKRYSQLGNYLTSEFLLMNPGMNMGYNPMMGGMYPVNGMNQMLYNQNMNNQMVNQGYQRQPTNPNSYVTNTPVGGTNDVVF